MKLSKFTLFLSTVMALFYCLPIFSVSETANFDANRDLEHGTHWATETLLSLVSAGIISNGEITIEEYDIPINRGSFTDLFMRLFSNRGVLLDDKYTNSNENYSDAGLVFADVPVGSLYYAATAQAKSNQIVMGFPDGSFHPEEHIQRQDVFAIIGRALENGSIPSLAEAHVELKYVSFADDQLIEDYAKEYVYILASRSFIIGYEDGTIRPANDITYAEALAIIERMRKEMAAANIGNADNSTHKNVPTPAPVITATVSPTQIPSPTPYAIAYQAANSGVSSSGGNGSYGSGSSAQRPPASGDNNIYEFDGSALADIDSLISLKNIKSITVTGERYGYEYFKPITLSSLEEKKIVIDALRGTRIRTLEPLYIASAGYPGGYDLSLQYADGTQGKLHVHESIRIGDEAGQYPITWFNESAILRKSIGQAMLMNYRGKGLWQIKGTWSRCIDKNEIGETWELILGSGATSLYRFNYNTSSSIIACVPQLNMEHSEVEVYFANSNSMVAERVFVLGPEDTNPEPIPLRYKISQALSWQAMQVCFNDIEATKMLQDLQESRPFITEIFGAGTIQAKINPPYKVRRMVENAISGIDPAANCKFSDMIENDDFYFITSVTNSQYLEGTAATSYGCELKKAIGSDKWQFYVNKDDAASINLLNAYDEMNSLNNYDNTYLADMFSTLGITDIDDIRYVDVGKPERLVLAYFNASGVEYGCFLNMTPELAMQTGLENLSIYPINDIIEKLK